jgi:hypothetical protein
MPPPGSVLARGDSLPQTHVGTFGISAQRDHLKFFLWAIVQRSSICAGRSYLETFTARIALQSGDLHWTQSSIVQRPSGSSLGAGNHWLETRAPRRARTMRRPAPCAERYYVETCAVRRAARVRSAPPLCAAAARYCRKWPALPDENWVRFVISGGRYFSLRVLCRCDLALSANSTSWRIASEREGLSGCCFAQVSIADLSSGESRIADTGSLPVAGRPRFLFGSTLFVDMLSVYW